MASDSSSTHEAWTCFVDGLRAAGDELAEDTADLDDLQRADAYRALLRGLNNQLGRFEVDRERPELVAFNGWREKMFMDNPDFRYWVADIRDDGRYRITGTVGGAVYTSITVYTSGGTLDAAATARIDSDALTINEDGGFALTLSREQPGTGGDWLALPEGASAVWVRQFHHDARHDRLGSCDIEPLDDVAVSPPIERERFVRHLTRLGESVEMFPAIFAASVRDDLATPNACRHWSEMAAGAAFTEPDIHYVRGSWQLDDGEGAAQGRLNEIHVRALRGFEPILPDRRACRFQTTFR